MKATAKSGSIPPLHPAMIEIVPVGATVVRLQLRRRRWSRTRLPEGLRAHSSSGPQIDSSQAGKTPRNSASFSDATLVSSSMKAMTVRPSATPSSEFVAYAEPHQQVGPAHDPEPHAADLPGQVGDLAQRVAVGVDHVVEEVGGQVHDAAEGVPVDAVFRALEVPVAGEGPHVDAAQVADVVREQRLVPRTGWWPRRSPAPAPGCARWRGR